MIVKKDKFYVPYFNNEFKINVKNWDKQKFKNHTYHLPRVIPEKDDSFSHVIYIPPREGQARLTFDCEIAKARAVSKTVLPISKRVQGNQTFSLNI